MMTTNTMRMTDITIEETSTVESRQSSIAESTTETASSEMSTMQTSEMNVTEIIGRSGRRPEEVEDITAMLEIIPEESIPIK